MAKVFADDVALTNLIPGPYHDIGIALRSPGVKVEPGVPIAPIVVVANRGTYDETGIPVHVLIDSAGTAIYDQIVNLSALDSAATDSIDFPSWVPGPGGNTYELTAWHGFTPDTNRYNDTIHRTIRTRTHDVTALAANFGRRVRTGQPFTPRLTLSSTGDYTEHAFSATCWIDSAGIRVYDQTVPVDSAAPGTPVWVAFPAWTPGPESTVYAVTLFHNLAADQVRSNDTLHRSVVSSNFVMRVAIEMPAGSPGRTPPNAIYAIDSLCRAEGWEDSIVTGEDINTVEKLSQYSVVISGSDGHYQQTDFALYQDALIDWVRSGGGFVGCGWIIYGINGELGAASRMDTLLPARTTGSYNYAASGTVTILNNTHPITVNVADFNLQNYGEYPVSGLWPDAVQLGSYSANPSGAAIACREIDAGRTVYLGPIFYGDFATYANEPYYTDADASRLLKQALEWAAMGALSGVRESPPKPVELRFGLEDARPNPFAERTVIRYCLPQAANVRIEVFDVSGRSVATLVNGAQPAGRQSANWNRTDASGARVPAGIYVCHLVSGGSRTTRKLVVE